MALEVGTNSYISEADADTYFADRLNAESWTGDNRSKALIQATKMIDFKKFKGVKTSEAQALKFPRIGLVDDGVIVDRDTVPQKVKDATCELAIYLLQEDYSAPDDLAEFGSVKVGSIEVNTQGGGRTTSGGKELPPFVKELLKFAVSSKSMLRLG